MQNFRIVISHTALTSSELIEYHNFKTNASIFIWHRYGKTGLFTLSGQGIGRKQKYSLWISLQKYGSIIWI
jgi:hypothetical protein